jgi:hypothetical protein
MKQITGGAARRATVMTTATATATATNQVPTTARSHAIRVGLDLAKRVIRVHAVDSAGRVLTRRAQ